MGRPWLHFYTGGGFDFALPKAALAQKGFSVYRFINRAPSVAELEKALSKANQLWIVSGDQAQLTAEHVKLIKNSAAWLAKYERFGKDVLSSNLKADQKPTR